MDAIIGITQGKIISLNGSYLFNSVGKMNVE
jgi:hypothetical protein